MSDERNQPWELGSDLPVEDPAEDAYGYALFASRLATAIVDNKSPKGSLSPCMANGVAASQVCLISSSTT